MKFADKPRIITVGSVTGNDNTVGGGGVYPIADLRELEGLANGAKEVSFQFLCILCRLKYLSTRCNIQFYDH